MVDEAEEAKALPSVRYISGQTEIGLKRDHMRI